MLTIPPAASRVWLACSIRCRARSSDLALSIAPGRRKFQRAGFASAGDADDTLERIRELVRLADSPVDVARIGDLIWAASVVHGQLQLPSAGVIRRRLALRADPASSGETFGQAWPAGLPGKKRLRPSSRRRLEQIGEHWLLPVLADVQLEWLNGAHCAAVFDRIERINAEVEAALVDSRKAVPEGDSRKRSEVIGIASQHRVFAALRDS
jgi:hypothetical protein